MNLRHPDLLLDEFVRWLDPMPWHRPRIRGLNLERQCELVLQMVQDGLLQRVGVAGSISREGLRETDPLYGPTLKGLEHWEQNIKGKRRQMAGGGGYPRYPQSVLVAASNPATVFDLARTPWRHTLTRDLDE